MVSRIGHKTQAHDVMVRAPGAYRLDFQLDEDVIALGGIAVAAERDPYSIMFFGYMSFERMADMLPKAYRPAKP